MAIMVLLHNLIVEQFLFFGFPMTKSYFIIQLNHLVTISKGFLTVTLTNKAYANDIDRQVSLSLTTNQITTSQLSDTISRFLVWEIPTQAHFI